MALIARRKLLIWVAFAPAIVKASSLMAIKPLSPIYTPWGPKEIDEALAEMWDRYKLVPKIAYIDGDVYNRILFGD